MSASQEKRRRLENRDVELEKVAAEKAAANKKKTVARVRNIVIAVVVVLVIAAIVVINSNLFYTGMAAVEIDGVEYTAAEVSYMYNSIYMSYVNDQTANAEAYGMDATTFLSMMGLNTQLPLDEQTYPIDSSMTWHDHFLMQALDGLKELTAVGAAAKAAGFELSQEDKDTIDTDLANMKSYIEMLGVYGNFEQYVRSQYGKGVTEETLREMSYASKLVSLYAESVRESFTYEDAELDAWYEEHRDENDLLIYREFYVDGSVSADVTEPTDEQKAEAKAEAKKTADAMAAKIKDDKSFIEQAAANSANADTDQDEATKKMNLGSSVNSTYSEWLLSADRKAGDVTVAESANGYYVVMFSERDDQSYPLQKVRHVLVKAEADENGEFTDEAKAKAKEEAEGYLAEWKAGDATEESFADLAKRVSQDTGSRSEGGLYDAVMKNAYVEEFEAFAFDESRKSGDTGIVYGETGGTNPYAGYHIMYYVGEGQIYSRYIAENSLRSADFEAWKLEQLDSVDANTSYTIKYVGK